MERICAYDGWCSDRVKALLAWLEEWFSIGQKGAERGMMAVYFALLVLPPPWEMRSTGMKVFTAVLIFPMMWYLHRKPVSRRRVFQDGSVYSAAARVSLQVLLCTFSLSGILRPPHLVADYANAAMNVVYLVFFYATDIGGGGDRRGRRRKLALAKLKELFGPLWIPQPVEG